MAKNKIFFNGKGVSIEDIVQIDESMLGNTLKYHKEISQPSDHKSFFDIR